MFATIHDRIDFFISRHVIFFENQYLFPNFAFIYEIHVLVYFDDLPSTSKCFKPGFVYERCCPTLPLLEFDPPFELVQMILFMIELDSSPIPYYYTRLYHPLD